MTYQTLCRGCRVDIKAVIIPGFIGIGSLFGDDEANEIADSSFCTKCKNSLTDAGACLDVLNCGHESVIFNGQKNKEVCHHPTCGQSQTEEDDCIFCSEMLVTSACVTFKCGHLFHKNCMEKQLNYLYGHGQVNITNSLCPFCKTQIEWEKDPEFGYDFGTLVENAAKLRVHMEGLCAAQIKMENGSDALPSNVLEYGMKHFSFFNCHKCKSIYCGGKRECGDSEPVPESEMLCGGCRGCPKHGMDMMTFKCRFCCSEAMWFCFGHTHFCDPCHSNAHVLAGGDNYLYMKNHPKMCMGKDSCPLKMDHPPHGEEFAIRCIACEEDKVCDEFGFGVGICNLYEDRKVLISLEELPNLDMAMNNLFKDALVVHVDDEENEFFAEDFGFALGNMFAEREVELDWGDEIGDLFGDGEDVEEQIPAGDGEPAAIDEPEEANLQSLFYEICNPEPISTPSSSSSLLNLFSVSKMLYSNWPQYLVVAATAAFLNGVSYTVV